jgi:phosphate transport system substrate-binding protein
VCTTLRADGAFDDSMKHALERIQAMRDDAGAVGIFRFGALELTGIGATLHTLDGDMPEPEAISSGQYGATLPLYLYVKNQHYDHVPGLLEFVNEFTSEWTWGPEGYLVDEGLIPLSEADRHTERANAVGLIPLFF